MTAVAYFSIPVALWVFTRRRRDLSDLQVKGLFLLFALFILLCGTTHVMDVVVIWKPLYWVDSLIRIATGAVSILTALRFWPLIPYLLKLPSPSALRSLNADLEARVAERTAELEIRTQEAESANRAKDNFFATMSHELRTPLNAVLGYCEILKEEAQETNQPPQTLEDLGHIQTSADHLLGLIDDILDISTLQAQSSQLSLSCFSADQLLQELQQILSPLAAGQENRLLVIFEDARCMLTTDYQRLRHILLNLLRNANKFTAQGDITLQVTCDDHRCRFTVSDTGIGIAPEHLERIFEKFYQVDSSSTRQYMGMGLGLTIAAQLTARLHGQLDVESRLGVGSRFYLTLPRQLDAAAPENALTSQRQPVG